jgi:hypothetical protein
MTKFYVVCSCKQNICVCIFVYLKEKIQGKRDACFNGYETNTSILDPLISQAWSHAAYGPPSKYFNKHAQGIAFLLLASLHNLRCFTFDRPLTHFLIRYSACCFYNFTFKKDGLSCAWILEVHGLNPSCGNPNPYWVMSWFYSGKWRDTALKPRAFHSKFTLSRPELRCHDSVHP